MKVLILGSGVIEVTTAHYLAKAGHEVTVIDRQPGPALETSFANAGQISPGYSSPWAGPGIPLKAIKWSLMRYGPLSSTRRTIPMWTWLLKCCAIAPPALLREQGTHGPPRRISRDRFGIADDAGIAYDSAARAPCSCSARSQQFAGLATTSRCCNIRRALRTARPGQLGRRRTGAGQGPRQVGRRAAAAGDETGDCKLFTDKLAAMRPQRA